MSMHDVEWVNEHECRFIQSAEEVALRSLARQYHEATEELDQLRCSERDKRGIAVATNPTERHQSVCFAIQTQREFARRAETLGFSLRAWREAVSSEARQFETDWVNGRYRNDPLFGRAASASTSPSAT